MIFKNVNYVCNLLAFVDREVDVGRSELLILVEMFGYGFKFSVCATLWFRFGV